MRDRPHARRLPLSSTVAPVIINAGVVLLVATYAMPFVYLLLTSVKPAGDVLQIPPSFLPTRLSVANYVSLFDTPSIPHAFANSLSVALLSTILALILAVSASYGASFFRTRLSPRFLLFSVE